jgi:mono/diheme cytochrome c family protein
MNYPIWEPAIANSTLIAVVAILHVFVSHFAIGGGLYLVVMETWARRRNDVAHLAYIQRHSKFFVLTTLVFGAVTGVGIWITIGLIHPTGTKWLINNFVWGWATEWVFFFVEIAAALLYLYGWRRLTARAHMTIGWIYFVAAWLSLVIINGILTFMLTPGQWLTTGNFWDGFLNPGYFPALVFRTFICVVLAGLYAALTGAREKDLALKVRMMRVNGLMVLVALLLAIPSGLWYYHTLPTPLATTVAVERVPALAFQIMLFSGALLFFLTLLGTVLFPRRAGYVSAAILLLCALMSMGGFEWAREAIRKPFIIRDFLYSNGLLAADAATLPAQEPLAVTYSTGDRGHDLYLKACRSCHTISGYHALAPRMAGRSVENIAALIPRLQFYREQMPPFPGNKDDIAILAKYLHSIADPDPLVAISNLADPQKEEIVFARHCGGCHTMNGFRPLQASFAGISASDADGTITSLSEMTDQMPPFIGTPDEKRLLIQYLTGGSK